MDRLSGAVGSMLGKAWGLAHRGRSAEERRQAFFREFGQYPPDHEATKTVREQFGREVVRPVLTQRARAVQQADPRTEAAFARAYQLAVGLKLAEKGQTYRDYLGPRA